MGIDMISLSWDLLHYELGPDSNMNYKGKLRLLREAQWQDSVPAGTIGWIIDYND